MKKKKLDEIQFARALAMFSVLFVHSTSYGIATLNPESSLYPIYTGLNTLGKMGVPVFFMLSGFVLFFAYYKREFTQQLVMDFYKKRIKYIVIPYLAISALYVTYYHIFYYHYPNINTFIKEYIQFVIHGNASYHTYFLFVLIQFYLLFPLLLWVTKKLQKMNPFLFLIGLGIHLVFWKMNMEYGWIENTAIFFLSYFVFFLLGSQVGIYYNSIRDKIIKHKFKWCIGVFATYIMVFIILAVLDYSIFTGKHLELIMEYPFYTWYGISNYLWMAQGILASLLLIVIGLIFNELRTEWIKKVLLQLATASFGIYLFHPVIMDVVSKFLVTSNNMMFHVYQFLIFVIILIGSWIITSILMKSKIGWILIGK